MSDKLAQQAIDAALSSNWCEAEEINKQILKSNNDDLGALNRLTRAYEELGKPTLAKRSANRALKIDPYNKIATRQIARLKNKNRKSEKNGDQTPNPTFIEEPGKTKLVTLLNIGSESVIASLDAGYEVQLNPHAHRVSVLTQKGKYIGRLPDDLAARLRRLIKSGNEYEVYIKSINSGCVIVFIKETKRAEKMVNIPSFSSEKIDYISFTPPELVHKKNKVVDTN